MIQRVNWDNHREFEKISLPDQVTGKITSPFDQDAFSRPLRMTFHFKSLKNLLQDEKDALEALKEFSSQPLVEALQIGEGSFTPIKFCEVLSQFDNRQIVEVDYGNHQTSGWTVNINWLQDLAKELASGPENGNGIQQQIYDDLLDAHASLGMGQDIFVTSSMWLLDNRSHKLIAPTNPRTPLETLKILGLLMRSRADFHFAKGMICNQTLYYQIFTFSKIPALWRYFNVVEFCYQQNVQNNISELGNTIISRSVRAVQALDQIGAVFYRRQAIETQDNMMYHFDYLCLLFSGILDAQALIVYRLLKPSKHPREHLVSFRHKDFLKQIEEKNPELSRFICEDRNGIVLDLIAEVRNTIHREKLLLLDVNNQITNEQHKWIPIPEIHNPAKPEFRTLWELCQEIKSTPEWGIIQDGRNMFIEPYSFANNLFERTFEIVSEIAKKTDFAPLSLNVDKSEFDKIPQRWEQHFRPIEKVRRFILLG